ncbi:MAG TPA: aminotransferase class IV [Vicinamibacterales bacterium]|nr:aminotransferase class IV [Vicinamibacterales bacterium]
MEFSLLETMRLDAGTIVRLEGHLRRLSAAAAHFDFRYDEAAIRSAMARTAHAHPEDSWRVRLLLAKDGTPTIECTRDVAEARGPWRVAFATDPVDQRDPFLFNKTTHRVVYDTARRARPDVDDVILWNERGEVTEATIANVVVEIDGVRYTPPIACGLLGGVFRAELLASGHIHERVLTRADVSAASRLWLINSVREWVDAELVGG